MSYVPLIGGGASLHHLRDLDDFGLTMGVTGGKVVTPPSAVRPCRRGVPPRRL
jgi:hypothetical protein